MPRDRRKKNERIFCTFCSSGPVMSSIGSTSIAGLGFAGSIVGSSQPEAAVDQSKAASAEQKATRRPKRPARAGLGRHRGSRIRHRSRRGRPALVPPFAVSLAANGDEDELSNPQVTPPRPADALGESGKSLDIEA